MMYRYRTVLVYLNDRRRAEAVLEPAVELASRYQAHLIGIHVYASVPAPPIAVPDGSKVLGSIALGERQESDDIAATFARMTANQPVVAEWHALKVPHMDLASVVLDHARAVDLVIAGQADPDWEQSPLMDFPERLALESGRPTLVIPYAGRYRKIGRNVVIAWKGGRESARAVPCLSSQARRLWTYLRSRRGAATGIPSRLTPRLRHRSRAMASRLRYARRARPTSASVMRSSRAWPIPARTSSSWVPTGTSACVRLSLAAPPATSCAT